jgi:hypothetical protein
MWDISLRDIHVWFKLFPHVRRTRETSSWSHSTSTASNNIDSLFDPTLGESDIAPCSTSCRTVILWMDEWVLWRGRESRELCQIQSSLRRRKGKKSRQHAYSNVREPHLITDAKLHDGFCPTNNTDPPQMKFKRFLLRFSRMCNKKWHCSI